MNAIQTDGHRAIIKDKKLVLIDGNTARREFIEKNLLACELDVVAKLNHYIDIHRPIDELKPDFLIVSIDELNTSVLAQLASITGERPMPVIVFAEKDAPAVVDYAIKAGVSAYVVADIQPYRFPVILHTALSRFADTERLRTELEKAKKQLSDRKIIDRAKGILMEQKHISENDAYRHLRSTAMRQGVTIAEISATVITAFELLHS